MAALPLPTALTEPVNCERAYLDLLVRVLTRKGFPGSWLRDPAPGGRFGKPAWKLLGERLDRADLVIKKRVEFSEDRGAGAALIPEGAETMIGVRRLESLRECVTRALDDEVPGDLIETGVWRGGACILMKGALAAREVTDRVVWVADSFEGLPPPSGRYEADAGSAWHKVDTLAVSQDEVEESFRRYGLLDDNVRFLKGWFSETLPTAPIERLAVLRLDGDMYESTIDALNALYPKVSPGGYVIIDDYGCVPACRAAVSDYREANGIGDEIHKIDWTGVYWRKSG
jgi:O-methyltransferase